MSALNLLAALVGDILHTDDEALVDTRPLRDALDAPLTDDDRAALRAAREEPAQ